MGISKKPSKLKKDRSDSAQMNAITPIPRNLNKKEKSLKRK